MKCISFSAVCYDIYPDIGVISPGGNSLNFAVQMAKLGIKDISVAGFIGNDDEGEKILKLCSAAGINTGSLVQMPGETASNRLYLTDEGERYSKPGEWKNGVRDEGRFSEKNWTFILSHDIIATTYNDVHLEELLKRKKTNHKIIVDFMHLVSQEILERYLALIDIAFLSPLTIDPEGYNSIASKFNKPIVAMLGAHGSMVFHKGEIYKKPARKVEKVMDTTGCGDAYQAGFCYAWFHSAAVMEAMDSGTTTATHVLQGIGGVY